MANKTSSKDYAVIITPTYRSNPINITDQTSDSPRAVHAIRDHISYAKNITQALFRRGCVDLDGVILHIMFSCNFHSVLALRLVSREFCDLASKEKIYPYTPLANSAAISFLYNKLHPTELHPVVHESILQKFNFAKANTEVHIMHSIYDLLKISPILDSIPENRLKLILEIQNITELNQLKDILLEQSNAKFINKIQVLEVHVMLSINDLLNLSPTLDSILENRLKVILTIRNIAELNQLSGILLEQSNPKFITRIKGLDIRKININNTIKESLISISQNLNSLESFTDLAVQNLILLPNFLTFTNLTIENLFIKEKEVLDLPNTLKKLKIGLFSNFRTVLRSFNLSDTLISLTNFTIGRIFNDFILTLPASLSNLTSVSIQSISKYEDSPPGIKLTVYASCNRLRNLSIGKIGEKTHLTLAYSLDNLLSLEIRSIEKCATLTLSNSLKNLENLEIGTIHRDVTLNLSVGMLNLVKISIGFMYKNCTLNWPSYMPKLESLSIDYISRNCSFNWPSMPNLLSLTIGSIHAIDRGCSSGIFYFPASMPNLSSLSIGETYNTNIILPASLPNLKDLTIKGLHATLVSTTLDGPNNFMIETPHDDNTAKLLTLINDRINRASLKCGCILY